MPKGRRFAPSSDNDGIWFQQRGVSCKEPLMRTTHTNTGIMLSEPFGEQSQAYPSRPPHAYMDKNAASFKTSNNFSNHDNRHSHQDHGVYFGNGQDTRFYGRRLTSPTSLQHYTDNEFLKHFGRHVINHDYSTVYRKDFEGTATEEPPIHRRFPCKHKEGNRGLAKLSTNTTQWLNNDNSNKTSLQVLANSQEPFLKHNKWKYSYHGLPKCYPSVPNKIFTNKRKPDSVISFLNTSAKEEISL